MTPKRREVGSSTCSGHCLPIKESGHQRMNEQRGVLDLPQEGKQTIQWRGARRLLPESSCRKKGESTTTLLCDSTLQPWPFLGENFFD